MICPHCNKPITHGAGIKIPEPLKQKAVELYIQGLSYRDIEKILDYKIGQTSIVNAVREARRQKRNLVLPGFRKEYK